MLKETEDMFKKYDKIAKDFEEITGIYQRQDILLATDLTYHSVLKFKFQERVVNKGWIETLVMGDTRTGKTASIQGLMNYYQLGEFGSGEATSFAGLVGGLSQVNNRWNIQWGKIPLNDRRLFVIDEVSGLTQDEIALMSGIRSAGVAEITKIQSERTRARTRLIWISNPRKANPLSSYTYGCLAIKELIGKPEDISRFDIVITSASGDVKTEVYNRITEKHDITYDFKSCRNLILWAWSRKMSQVDIGKKTTEAILDYSSLQGKKYNSSIPIVEAAEQRIKLAKIAVATACRFFSCSEDGERVLVKPQHAEFAYCFLEMCYSKNSLRYNEWSKKQNDQLTLKNPELLKTCLPPDTVEMFMESEIMNLSDVEDMTGDRNKAKKLVKVLRNQRAFAKISGSYYKKTPAFISFLRSVQREEIQLDYIEVEEDGQSKLY